MLDRTAPLIPRTWKARLRPWATSGFLVAAALVGPARSQEAPGAHPPPDTAAPPALSERPQVLLDAQPLYPPEAWDSDVEGDVVLLLWVDEQGGVEAAEVISTPGYGMELAALAAARKMRFSPARLAGTPVKVKIRYTFRFRKPEKGTLALPPPPSAESSEDGRPKGRFRGRVLQRGTGNPLRGAEVYLLDLDRAVLTDEEGRFDKELSPGGYAITINAPGHHAFETLERLDSREVLEVEYFIEERRRERYRTVVWGDEGKATVGRTFLTDAEIYEVPGTVGDPIRVVMLMPGVTTSVSGLSYPVVRGALPGDTRYEMDGVQVPMLYHLMFGNAVVNPRFTGGLSFEPGGYSVQYGQFPGARIAGDAAPAPDDPVYAPDLSVIQSSLFHARPLTEDLQVLGAARYGTLGLIIEGLASNAIFKYWDYQTKAFWDPSDRDHVELLAFGAGNEVGEELADGGKDVLVIHFHRLLLRERRTLEDGWLELAVELGQEGFDAPEGQEDEGGSFGDPGAEDRAGEARDSDEDEGMPEAGYSYAAIRTRASRALAPRLELRAGTEAYLQDFGFDPDADDLIISEDGITLGGYLELEWTPGSWTVIPGVRADHYRYGIGGGPRQTGVDPRLAVGYDVTEWLTLKAAAGVYQGPPRVTIAENAVVMGPVPGMMGIGLEEGLSRSVQLAGGAEATLPWRFQLGIQGYHNYLRTGLDFSLMNEDLESNCEASICDGMGDPGDEEDEMPLSTSGRSYGLEFMLRRRLGGSMFGWTTYSLSRSERRVKGYGSFPFRFDQTHVVNAVLSWEVGRHWTLGTTYHYHSGRPYTPEYRYECESQYGPPIPPSWHQPCQGEPFSKRLPGFWRIDVRIQKREVFDTWHFDFYIDILNVTFNQETVSFETDWDGTRRAEKALFFVPMLGLRAYL